MNSSVITSRSAGSCSVLPVEIFLVYLSECNQKSRKCYNYTPQHSEEEQPQNTDCHKISGFVNLRGKLPARVLSIYHHIMPGYYM